MTSRQIRTLAIVFFLLWLLEITVLRLNLNSHVRYFSDDGDRQVYFERGAWFPNGEVPYRDTISEYPQIPTYFFGLLYILIPGEKNSIFAYLLFSSYFVLAMLIVLFALIDQLYRVLPDRKYLAFLFLLPAPLYYTFNRFDILPAYLCLLSFVLVARKQWGLASVILAVATLTKWYPVLLLPAYLAYCFHSEGRINWRMILLFSVTCLLILLPTLLLGGLDALLVPYRFQGVRGLEPLSLPAMIGRLQEAISDQTIVERYYILGFLFLQGIAALIALFARIDRIEKLVQWCILIISLFVLFARIYSPQWLVWILPFLILAARDKIDLIIIVVYSVVAYLGFPVVFDAVGKSSSLMFLMSAMNFILLAIIAGRSIRQIWSNGEKVNPNLMSSS
jgi:hypothetical protein